MFGRYYKAIDRGDSLNDIRKYVACETSSFDGAVKLAFFAEEAMSKSRLDVVEMLVREFDLDPRQPVPFHGGLGVPRSLVCTAACRGNLKALIMFTFLLMKRGHPIPDDVLPNLLKENEIVVDVVGHLIDMGIDFNQATRKGLPVLKLVSLYEDEELLTMVETAIQQQMVQKLKTTLFEINLDFSDTFLLLKHVNPLQSMSRGQ